MSKNIILPNKWSLQERLKICERIVQQFSDLTNALGFKVTILSCKEPGHCQAGIQDRRRFDLPTVITHAQLMRGECNTLLKQLGCADEKENPQQKSDKGNDKSNGHEDMGNHVG